MSDEQQYQDVKENKMVPLVALYPHSRNYKQHPPEQIKKLVASLERFGQVRSIVCQQNADSSYTIVAGHGVYEAAEKLKYKELRADILPSWWSAEQVSGYLVADNELGNDAVDDETILATLLTEQQNAGYDLATLGTDDETLRQMLESLGDEMLAGGGEAGDDFDITPEEGPTRTRIGEIWQLGVHRLLVGDSTNKGNVKRLLKHEAAVLVHADPPYGMGKEKEGVANDNLYREKLDKFQMQWLDACFPCLAENASVYIWGTDEDLWRLWYRGGLRDSLQVTFRNEIVWNKQSGQGMNSDQHRMYPTASERCLFFILGEQGFNTNSDNYWEGWEPIRLYLEKERLAMGWDIPTMKRIVGHSDLSRDHWTSKSQWLFPTCDVYTAMQFAAKGSAFKREYDDLKREFYTSRAYFNNTHDIMTDVWLYPRVLGNDRQEHPTPKPIAMIERIVKSSAPEDGLVYEPFLGSGTTLIACHRTGRRCVGIEIEPRYADIILSRYEAETGETATLLERNEEAAHA